MSGPALRSSSGCGGRRRAGQLERQDLARVAAELDLPRAHVNGAASFYSELGPVPHGRRRIRACVGTACLAATGAAHVSALGRELRVEEGTVSEDGGVSLEGVYCLGYCYGGPSALDGERPHAGPDLSGQLTGRARLRDPPIPFASAVSEPVALGGLLGAGPASWSVWPGVCAIGAGASGCWRRSACRTCGVAAARSSRRR